MHPTKRSVGHGAVHTLGERKGRGTFGTPGGLEGLLGIRTARGSAPGADRMPGA